MIGLYSVNETFCRNVHVWRRPVPGFFVTGFILGKEAFGGSCTWVCSFDQKNMYQSMEWSVFLPNSVLELLYFYFLRIANTLYATEWMTLPSIAVIYTFTVNKDMGDWHWSPYSKRCLITNRKWKSSNKRSKDIRSGTIDRPVLRALVCDRRDWSSSCILKRNIFPVRSD